MPKLEKNNWFVQGNDLSISLLCYYAFISNKNGKYKLEVIGKSDNWLVMNFDTLEDAMIFTEKTVANCYEDEEITQAYEDKYKGQTKGKVKTLKREMIKRD